MNATKTYTHREMASSRSVSKNRRAVASQRRRFDMSACSLAARALHQCSKLAMLYSEKAVVIRPKYRFSLPIRAKSTVASSFSHPPPFRVPFIHSALSSCRNPFGSCSFSFACINTSVLTQRLPSSNRRMYVCVFRLFLFFRIASMHSETESNLPAVPRT